MENWNPNSLAPARHAAQCYCSSWKGSPGVLQQMPAQQLLPQTYAVPSTVTLRKFLVSFPRMTHQLPPGGWGSQRAQVHITYWISLTAPWRRDGGFPKRGIWVTATWDELGEAASQLELQKRRGGGLKTTLNKYLRRSCHVSDTKLHTLPPLMLPHSQYYK